MKHLFRYIILLAVMITAFSCKGPEFASINDTLLKEGWSSIPSQEDYPESGAVILDEKKIMRMEFKSSFELVYEHHYYLSMVYFNDKAEHWLKHSIYLNPTSKFKNFSAKTIKPDGQVIELGKDDLHLVKMNDKTEMSEYLDIYEFTFPGVEEGAVLEFTYSTEVKNGFFSADMWDVQKDIPVKRTSYTVDVPAILYYVGINWTHTSYGLSLPKTSPIDLGHPLQAIRKNLSQEYVFQDIEALPNEVNSPTYMDVARFVSFNANFSSWNELMKAYWKRIEDHFGEDSYEDVKDLALEIAGDAETDREKIRRVFEYTQRNFRYIDVGMDYAGDVPRDLDEILEDKTGDCKDMTSLNVNLLRALGITAYPAVVQTKDRMHFNKLEINFDFDHMLTFAKTEDKQEFWLDAAGTNCPLGEIYSTTEGKLAHIILPGGIDSTVAIPASVSYNNQVIRRVNANLNGDGELSGNVQLTFTGEENLQMRNSLKDATAKDMEDVVKDFTGTPMTDLEIKNITYDDPNVVTDTFRVNFDFSGVKFIGQPGSMVVFNPNIFDMRSELDKYSEEERKLPVRYYYPFRRKDYVEMTYDGNKYEVVKLPEPVMEKSEVGRFRRDGMSGNNNNIAYFREFFLEKEYILPKEYKDFRKLHSAIAEANNEKMVLKIK